MAFVARRPIRRPAAAKCRHGHGVIRDRSRRCLLSPVRTAEPDNRGMGELPAGTITMLFSDIEGSTALLRRLGDRYADVLLAQRALLRAAFADYGGQEQGTEGDSFSSCSARPLTLTLPQPGG